MDTQEIDATLDELENRLDRLRALYEQYFLGIEKIEPAVARKDVDRRFWVLRRTQIRNTARRFRLQVLVQRYNTFQQYWTRICREIENGTYARHLLKAKKNLGAEPQTWAAKKRLGLLRRRSGESEPAQPENATLGGEELDQGDAELAAILDADDDTARASERAATAEANRIVVKSPAKPKVGTFTLEDLGPLDLDFEDEDTAPRPPPPAKPPLPAAAAPGAGAKPPLPVNRAPGAPGAKPPLPTAAKMPPSASAPSAPSAASAAAAPSAAVTMPRPAVPVASAPKPAVPVASAPKPAVPVASAPKPPAPAPAAGPAVPAASPRPATPVAASPRPAAAAPAAAPRLPTAAAPAAAPKPSPDPVANAAVGGLSDERVRKLHAELVETKRKLNQGDSVSVDALARSLRESEKKLRAQHGGRNIDFQIVVKDGKPVVKPVVRK